MSCDLLTDPYIAELRAMHAYVEAQLSWLDTLTAGPASELLSPDETGAVAGGSLSEQGARNEHLDHARPPR